MGVILVVVVGHLHHGSVQIKSPAMSTAQGFAIMLQVKDLELEVVYVLLGWLRKWWIDPLGIAAVSFIEIGLNVTLVCSTRSLGRVMK